MDASERRTRASADAAEWWLRLQSQEISHAEKQDYVAWLRESAVHVAEMLRIAQVHNALEQFDRWARITTDGAKEDKILEFPNYPLELSPRAAPITTEPAIPSVGSEGVRRHKRAIMLGGTLAASVLAAVAVTLLLSRWNGQTIETDRGERREVALGDGSVLQVDPETRLRVKFREHSRQIVLEQGRALFRVNKDPNRPFTVQAHDTIVRAVGTAFAVDRRNQAITVTVSEGKVAVMKEGANKSLNHETVSPEVVSTAATKDSNASPEPLLLIANQQVTVGAPGVAEPVRKVDADRELAWTQGRLIFDNDSVAAATSEFNRYNRVQLRITDSTLANRPVSGIFNASDPESFLAFIQTVTRVRIDRNNGQEITIAAAQP